MTPGCFVKMYDYKFLYYRINTFSIYSRYNAIDFSIQLEGLIITMLREHGNMSYTTSTKKKFLLPQLVNRQVATWASDQ